MKLVWLLLVLVPWCLANVHQKGHQPAKAKHVAPVPSTQKHKEHPKALIKSKAHQKPSANGHKMVERHKIQLKKPQHHSISHQKPVNKPKNHRISRSVPENPKKLDLFLERPEIPSNWSPENSDASKSVLKDPNHPGREPVDQKAAGNQEFDLERPGQLEEIAVTGSSGKPNIAPTALEGSNDLEKKPESQDVKKDKPQNLGSTLEKLEASTSFTPKSQNLSPSALEFKDLGIQETEDQKAKRTEDQNTNQKAIGDLAVERSGGPNSLSEEGSTISRGASEEPKDFLDRGKGSKDQEDKNQDPDRPMNRDLDSDKGKIFPSWLPESTTMTGPLENSSSPGNEAENKNVTGQKADTVRRSDVPVASQKPAEDVLKQRTEAENKNKNFTDQEADTVRRSDVPTVAQKPADNVFSQGNDTEHQDANNQDFQALIEHINPEKIDLFLERPRIQSNSESGSPEISIKAYFYLDKDEKDQRPHSNQPNHEDPKQISSQIGHQETLLDLGGPGNPRHWPQEDSETALETASSQENGPKAEGKLEAKAASTQKTNLDGPENPSNDPKRPENARNPPQGDSEKPLVTVFRQENRPNGQNLENQGATTQETNLNEAKDQLLDLKSPENTRNRPENDSKIKTPVEKGLLNPGQKAENQKLGDQGKDQGNNSILETKKASRKRRSTSNDPEALQHPKKSDPVDQEGSITSSDPGNERENQSLADLGALNDRKSLKGQDSPIIDSTLPENDLERGRKTPLNQENESENPDQVVKDSQNPSKAQNSPIIDSVSTEKNLEGGQKTPLGLENEPKNLGHEAKGSRESIKNEDQDLEIDQNPKKAKRSLKNEHGSQDNDAQGGQDQDLEDLDGSSEDQTGSPDGQSPRKIKSSPDHDKLTESDHLGNSHDPDSNDLSGFNEDQEGATSLPDGQKPERAKRSLDLDKTTKKGHLESSQNPDSNDLAGSSEDQKGPTALPNDVEIIEKRSIAAGQDNLQNSIEKRLKDPIFKNVQSKADDSRSKGLSVNKNGTSKPLKNPIKPSAKDQEPPKPPKTPKKPKKSPKIGLKKKKSLAQGPVPFPGVAPSRLTKGGDQGTVAKVIVQGPPVPFPGVAPGTLNLKEPQITLKGPGNPGVGHKPMAQGPVPFPGVAPGSLDPKNPETALRDSRNKLTAQGPIPFPGGRDPKLSVQGPVPFPGPQQSEPDPKKARKNLAAQGPVPLPGVAPGGQEPRSLETIRKGTGNPEPIDRARAQDSAPFPGVASSSQLNVPENPDINVDEQGSRNKPMVQGRVPLSRLKPGEAGGSDVPESQDLNQEPPSEPSVFNPDISNSKAEALGPVPLPGAAPRITKNLDPESSIIDVPGNQLETTGEASKTLKQPIVQGRVPFPGIAPTRLTASQDVKTQGGRGIPMNQEDEDSEPDPVSEPVVATQGQQEPSAFNPKILSSKPMLQGPVPFPGVAPTGQGSEKLIDIKGQGTATGPSELSATKPKPVSKPTHQSPVPFPGAAPTRQESEKLIEVTDPVTTAETLASGDKKPKPLGSEVMTRTSSLPELNVTVNLTEGSTGSMTSSCNTTTTASTPAESNMTSTGSTSGQELGSTANTKDTSMLLVNRTGPAANQNQTSLATSQEPDKAATGIPANQEINAQSTANGQNRTGSTVSQVAGSEVFGQSSMITGSPIPSTSQEPNESLDRGANRGTGVSTATSQSPLMTTSTGGSATSQSSLNVTSQEAASTGSSILTSMVSSVTTSAATTTTTASTTGTTTTTSTTTTAPTSTTSNCQENEVLDPVIECDDCYYRKYHPQEHCKLKPSEKKVCQCADGYGRELNSKCVPVSKCSPPTALHKTDFLALEDGN